MCGPLGLEVDRMTERGPITHLSAVAEVTRRSQQIALAALHEALTSPVSPERVNQLRRVADDLDREVGRLEAAMLELDPDADFNPSAGLEAEIVRTEDPPVRTAETQRKIDGLARIARMASGAGSGMPLIDGLRDRIFALSADLALDYPVTAEDAAGLGRELAEAGDVLKLRELRDSLVRESENPIRYGPALDVLLYGEVPKRPER